MIHGHRPHAWMICPRLGANSETWLLRQALGMTGLSMRVITQPAAGIREKPATAIDVHHNPWFAPARLDRPHPVGSTVRGLENWRYGFFRGCRDERRWLTRQIERERPAVVLCQYGPTAIRYAPLLASLGIPTVAHFHGYDLSRLIRRWTYRRLLRRARHQLDGFVVVALYMEQALRDLGICDKQIRRIPYGVPLGELPVSLGTGRPDCRFLSVGRFVEKKRPDLTLKAFAKCLQQVPDSRLTMIGDGPLLPACRRLGHSLQIEHAVEFLGSESFECVRQELKQASVYVQHSVTARNGDMEGWPVAIAEAAGSGIPVIATRHASIPEQVDDGQTGLLVDEGDWQAMAAAMTLLASDADRRAAMGIAARQKMDAYDLQHQLCQLQAFLVECASRAAA